MSIFNPNSQFSSAPPVIRRCKKYESKKLPTMRRDIATQVRDWLHSQDMTEEWYGFTEPTVWRIDGRPAVDLSITEEGVCHISIRRWVRQEIGKSGFINRMSRVWVLRSGADLHLIKPLIRLALNPSNAEWLRDTELMKQRLIGPSSLAVFGIFHHGLRVTPEVFNTNPACRGPSSYKWAA
mgnify:CR=1 FL=1